MQYRYLFVKLICKKNNLAIRDIIVIRNKICVTIRGNLFDVEELLPYDDFICEVKVQDGDPVFGYR